MGTRSLTIFREEDNTEIAVLYRQFDGYLSGHGNDLLKILSGMILVNGFTGDEGKAANGMACLACQVIAELKNRQEDGKIGSFYLYAAGTKDIGEEYTYIIKPGPVQKRKFGDAKWEKEYWPIDLTVMQGDREVYSGLLEEFDPVELEKGVGV